MDEHKLRLRFENGLSTSRGENAVRRLNKRLCVLFYSTAEHVRVAAAQELLRDQETLREIIHVQQLRARKVAKQEGQHRTDLRENRKAELESELKRKRSVYEELSSKQSRSEAHSRSEGRELLLPVANCESQIAQLKKKEEEIDRQLRQQEQDFRNWKKAAAEAEAVLERTQSLFPPPSPKSPESDLEPKTKSAPHCIQSVVMAARRMRKRDETATQE